MTDNDNESSMIVDSNVLPLQVHGILDAEVLDLSNNDVLAHALTNTSTEETYAIKYESDFVNKYPHWDVAGEHTSGDFEDPNHLLGTFPCLFPYGMGGFEVNHPCSISYKNQAKWAMRYGDKRFRKDLHFMFQVFGVIQKRQSLKQHVNTVHTKVMGTDESRMKIHTLIWGMTTMKNPPSLWITINTSDTHDPIAQVLVGEELNLDMFNPDSSPDACHHTLNVAADPYGAAQFFHYIIRAILEEILGVMISSKGRLAAKKVFLVFWRVTSALWRLKDEAPFTYT
ncbi:hypothetical protein F4604DRAFT_1915295 [Suillus subluteus]|nr:hypothetical protein F4604DRAFT_1915295 [Suillus subluteus]